MVTAREASLASLALLQGTVGNFRYNTIMSGLTFYLYNEVSTIALKKISGDLAAPSPLPILALACNLAQIATKPRSI